MTEDKQEPDVTNESNSNKSTKEATPEKKQREWGPFVYDKDTPEEDIITRLKDDIKDILGKYSEQLKDYSVLYLYDTYFDITSYDSDRIYSSLLRSTAKKTNVLLLLTSKGGRIEPAFHISRICLEYSKEKFVVVVPRAAKSAATLISLGAHEIHMGLLSELGPIDPQIRGMPVLGLKDSLEKIAQICEKYPKSSKMFSDYLTNCVYVPNIGYYERIGESAVQYAERLISNKEGLKERAKTIAQTLVYEYKDHGFIIGIEEAKKILDESIIKTNTIELRIAEEIHKKLGLINFLLGIFRDKYIRIVGDLESGITIQDPPKSSNR